MGDGAVEVVVFSGELGEDGRDVVSSRLFVSVRRRFHSAVRATGLDGHGISAGEVPLAAVDRAARWRIRVHPGTIPDESVHPSIRRAIHQTAQDR